MAMNYRIPAAAVIGLATSAIHLAAKLIPHERIVYRVEDEEGNTVGVFSSARKAARAGGNVVEEIVDPRVYDAYEVKLTPLGDPISRKRISSREPIRDDAYALGLDGQCEVAIVGVSAVSVVVADALAREGLEAFNQELAKIGSRMC